MKPRIQETEWLSLVDVSGPFLAPKVLHEVFPQGLPKTETTVRQHVRKAHEEWVDAVDAEDAELPLLHRAWIWVVLEEVLEADDEVLKEGEAIPECFEYRAEEHGETLRPDVVVLEPGGDRVRLAITIHDPDTHLGAPMVGSAWSASPVERMVTLLRGTNTRLGLVTNGEEWTLVALSEEGGSTYVTWYARLWWQEPVTLDSFQALLGVRRIFGPEDETLEALLSRSLEYQDEVTDRLGEQVKRAVEVLVQALDRADQDRRRELLKDVPTSRLYEAGLTVMMRLVFLLSAEERGLLLLGDPLYDQYYAVSTLRAQLRERADRDGLEVLERRWEAWARLLAIFRAVYAGVEHDALRMPALGGSLFDPDRFPFLEGRVRDSRWQDTPADPVPIDDRTVLMLLDALQVLEDSGGARLLSYRGLDVEQIGYVYEGLLERTVIRLPALTLGLKGSKKAKDPNLELDRMETARLEGEERLIQLVKEATERTPSSIRNDLKRKVEDDDFGRLIVACHGDHELAERIRPYLHLLRIDPWGYPMVYTEGSLAVTLGADRRETGTHYTPKTLTEAIVTETLEPVVYEGPAEGKPRTEWRLKEPRELLDLKVLDPAMGSGAFLVQVCRWLADRLLEAWEREEERGNAIDMSGSARPSAEVSDPIPKDLDERRIHARRLVAERCIYGVDINPMAVELAKLSIWLVTLSKGRPFGFLDHNLRSGDSLLGIHDLRQLVHLHMDPKDGEQLHHGLFDRRKTIQNALNEAIELRKAVRAHPIRDIHDVEEMALLDEDARKRLESLETIADALVGEALTNTGNQRGLNDALTTLAVEAGCCLDGDGESCEGLRRRANRTLATDLPLNKPARRPFHWPLEFPEVYQAEKAGFDAIVGNPPFMGGKKITGSFGTAFRTYIIEWLASGTKGEADLVAYFFLRAYQLLRSERMFGLLAVNTISEGNTRHVGLEQLLKMGATICAAYPNEPWPGKASVVTSRVHIGKGRWEAVIRYLNGKPVTHISAYLSDREQWTPKKLSANLNKAFQGSIILGLGFTMDENDALEILEENPEYQDVLFPYLIGKEVNRSPDQSPGRWVINFWDWPEEKARKYGKVFSIVEKLVKPERDRLKGNNAMARRYKRDWWLFGVNVKTLYHTIRRGHLFMSHPKGWDASKKPLERVIVCATGATKYPSFVFVPNKYVFANTLCVIADERYSLFSVLSSDIHSIWAWQQGSSLESRLRYTHGDIFETFPFPSRIDEEDAGLSGLGEEFFEKRKCYMLSNNKGLTKFYNDFHDPDISNAEIDELRGIQCRINELVMDRYGWGDVVLDHGFHDVAYLREGMNMRFTIGEETREEILYRLSILNKERYKEEVRQGLHEKKGSKIKKKAQRKTAPSVEEAETQHGLFDVEIGES